MYVCLVYMKRVCAVRAVWDLCVVCVCSACVRVCVYVYVCVCALVRPLLLLRQAAQDILKRSVIQQCGKTRALHWWGVEVADDGEVSAIVLGSPSLVDDLIEVRVWCVCVFVCRCGCVCA